MRTLEECSPRIPIVLLTASVKDSEATRLGATAVRSEPLDVEELLKRVSHAVPPHVRELEKSHPWGSESLAAHVVRELHEPETGRLDARRIAEYLALPISALADALDRSVAAIHKSSASLPLQQKLAPIAWTIGALSLVLRSRNNVLAWLNSPHPDLEGHTPISIILSGRATELSEMLRAALAGQPS